MPKNTVRITYTGDSRGLRRATSDAERQISHLGGTGSRVFKNLGRAAGVGLAVLSVGATIAGKKMIGLAGDAVEVDSKLNVVFGKQLPKVKKELDAFSAATGASRFQMREQAADMGALLGPILKNQDAAAGMSSQFVKLATDLGSFNNVPTADALLAIRSGLVGEAEPLRRFGVLLNEAAVKSQAYRSGLAKVGAELTEQQKVQARAALIMQQTTQAQGDATRTAGSYANQLKALKNFVRDNATALGLKLVPAATAAIGVLRSLAGWIAEIADAPNLKVRLDVAGQGIAKFATSVRTALSHALFGWKEIIPDLQSNDPDIRAASGGFATVFHAGLLAEFERLDWNTIGTKVGHGISAAIVFSEETVMKLIALLDAHADQFADVGARIGLHMVGNLFDPTFWFQNLDILAALLGARFGGGILRAVGGWGVRIGGRLARELGGAFLNLLARLPAEVGAVFAAAAVAAGRMFGRAYGLVSRVIGNIVGTLRGDLQRVLGAIPGWIRGAFKLGAVVAFWGAIKTAVEWVQRLIDWIGRIPTRIKIAVDLPNLPGGGGWVWRDGKLVRQAEGGVIPRVPGSREGVDSVPILAMPGEILVNPRNPARGLQALRDAGFEGFARGGKVKKRKRRAATPNERKAEQQERGRTELPKSLQLEIATARQQNDKPRLLAALRRAEAWLKRHISITRSIDNKIALTNELASVQDEIAQLVGEGDGGAELQAQLDQANRRLAAAQGSADLANAFVSSGVFGGGGGGERRGGAGGGGEGAGGQTFVFQSLIPDAEQIRRATSAIAQGAGTQPHRTQTRESLGL